MKMIICVSLALLALAAALPIDELRKQPAINYMERRDHHNQYDLAYETAEGIKVEERGELRRGPNNTVYLYKSGTSTWTDQNGVTFVTKWSSDDGGFHAEGAHLPVAPKDPAHEQPIN